MARKILIVDDDPDILQYLEVQLTESGCEVRTAARAQDALEILQREARDIDLVLSDVCMPEIDGLDLLKQILRQYAFMPVVLMTAHADLEISLSAIRLGAMDLILKPITAHEIQRILTRVESIQSRKLASSEVSDPLFSEALQITVPSFRRVARKAVSRIYEHFLGGLNATAIHPGHMRVCLAEAVENAVVHGNLGVSSELKETAWGAFEALATQRETDSRYTSRPLQINARLDSAGFEIIIRDQGDGFVPPGNSPTPSDPSALLASGRGLLLIKAMMDEVSWSDHGRCIRMHKSNDPVHSQLTA